MSAPSGLRGLGYGLAFVALAALAAASVTVVARNGWTLYYGDAEAHLNIARRILDSRTPGYEQIGTVWLPLPHLVMLPFVGNDALWTGGLAGAIPAALCFVLAGLFFFSSVRLVCGSASAAFASLAVFALNPNLLYLSSIPMTEPVLLAAFLGLLWCLLRFRESRSLGWAVAAGFVNLAATLTRYEGWFLIPFATLFIMICGGRGRWLASLLFGLIASLGPLWWLAHNYVFFGDAFYFFDGPWSAKGIYQRALDAGMARYPGDHHWPDAIRYYGAAVLRTAAWPAIAMASAGAPVLFAKRRSWPFLFLALPPVFYIWSLHSGGTPIFVPELWPHGYYNTRYGLPALPLLAACSGGLVSLCPRRWRGFAALPVAALALAPWLVRRSPDAWICWKESQVNSTARRAWTEAASEVLKRGYRPGAGIIAPFGDVTGVFREAGIPLRETLHEGNGPAWAAAIANPRFFLHEEWAVAISGDTLATAILHCQRTGPRYRLVRAIMEPGAPVIEIYRRD